MSTGEHQRALLDYELETLTQLIVDGVVDMRYAHWFSVKEAVRFYSGMTDVASYANIADENIICRNVAHKLKQRNFCVGGRMWLAGDHHTPVWGSQAQELRYKAMRNKIKRSNQPDNERMRFDLEHKYNFQEQAQ